MAHLYEVQTSEGAYNVSTPHHHDHLSKTDFERILLKAILDAVTQVGANVILHHYTYKGRR